MMGSPKDLRRELAEELHGQRRVFLNISPSSTVNIGRLVGLNRQGAGNSPELAGGTLIMYSREAIIQFTSHYIAQELFTTSSIQKANGY